LKRYRLELILPLLILFLLWVPQAAHAGPFHLEANLGLDYGSASLPGDSSTPTFGIGEIGGLVEFQWRHLLVGADADYATINQYSTVDPAVGNRRGNYLNPVSPHIGVIYGKFAARADVRFLGRYQLDNVNAALQSIEYDSPFGFRLSVSTQVSNRWWVGAIFERVSFSQQSTAGTPAPLASPMVLMIMGLQLGFRL
jgi:hypothetical protein